MDLNQQKYQYSSNMPNVGFSNTHGQVLMPQVPTPGGPGMGLQWMPAQNSIPGCPPGLEYLSQIDKILVKQQVELLEAFTGWETNNKYSILNAYGQQIYYAFEKSDTCMRLCCGSQRGFTIHIVNNLNQEVLRISREFKFCAGCCWCAGCSNCCAHEVMISLPNGEVIGYVKQSGSCWSPKYSILDADHNKILGVEGPCCICDGPFCPCENSFQIIGTDGSVIGKISKVYSGFAREIFTTADNFCMEFPADLHVKVKSALTGALFLIDFMFFEKKKNE